VKTHILARNRIFKMTHIAPFFRHPSPYPALTKTVTWKKTPSRQLCATGPIFSTVRCCYCLTRETFGIILPRPPSNERMPLFHMPTLLVLLPCYGLPTLPGFCSIIAKELPCYLLNRCMNAPSSSISPTEL
jgi:hypothetical protein